ncbi:MAG: zinc ribbon domain-containing protein [Proteobacteria bacterium]|nr:zinc ribbon domain-containing protein [Pseudomonadota bacterium]MBU1710942.1 zinc ribbon domain-containing protein [Pseudomonadota bacterium]
MPIYEYKCQDCNNMFEALIISANDLDQIECPKCESRKVKKTISASSFRLASSSSNSIPAGALSGCSTKSGFS